MEGRWVGSHTGQMTGQMGQTIKHTCDRCQERRDRCRGKEVSGQIKTAQIKRKTGKMPRQTEWMTGQIGELPAQTGWMTGQIGKVP